MEETPLEGTPLDCVLLEITLVVEVAPLEAEPPEKADLDGVPLEVPDVLLAPDEVREMTLLDDAALEEEPLEEEEVVAPVAGITSALPPLAKLSVTYEPVHV